MKKIILGCIVIFYTLPTQAQSSFPPAYYIDSQRVVDLGKIYFSVDSIAYLNVVNGADTANGTNGRIYFTFKQPYASFLTLADVTRKQKDFSEKKVLYIIDGMVIKDTTGIRIDPSFVLEVHAVSMADLPYLSDGKTNMGVVVIETKRKEPVPPKDAKGTIILRGSLVKQ